MPTRFFLNALRTQEGSLPAPGVGEWQSDPEFLTRYARSIHLDGQLEASSLSHSVPSVFQRPIQFYAALANKTHPLHQAIRSEWRGLMAVLGLSYWLGVNFTVSEFNVPPTSPLASSHVGNAAIGDLHFRTMLRNQLPTRQSSQMSGSGRRQRVSDWERWWVLRCDDRLLGATSPWTLVYTAARYRAPATIPWQRNGLLIDPAIYYDPQNARQAKPPELAILHAWVQDMLNRQTAWGYPPELGAFSNLLVTLLTDWAKDLEPYMRPNDFKVEQTRTFFNQAPYANLLGAPLLRGEDSDVFIETKRGKVLMLHEHMAPDTRVFGSTFAYQVDVSELPAEGREFKTRDGKLIAQPFLVAERFFFPAHLVRLALTESAYRQADASLPLPPAFFSYFDYKDLRWLSVMEIHGELTAALRLPLSNGRMLEIGHVYRRDDVISPAGGTPGLALWPDLYDEAWTGDFAACAANNLSGFGVRPLMRDGALAPERAENNAHQQQVRLWRGKSPMIGFALSLRTAQGAELNCGLVLRSDLREPAPLEERTWRVGVDFGTSSTTVMVSQGDGVSEMHFGAHLLKLTKVSDPQKEITRNLYPDMEVVPPFRTLLFHATATQFGPESTPYTLRFSDDLDSDLLNKPIKELKWGAQPRTNGANPLNVYLEALVRYIAWEARVQRVRNLELSWSYPTSLPQGALNVMRNFWDRVPVLNLHREMRLSVNAPMSESEAACRALAQAGARVRTEGLTISIDIGGGSTDIAYWSKHQLLDQVSFKIAGNDVLDPAFLNERTARAIYEACTGKQPSSAWVTNVKSVPGICVNGVLADAQRSADPRDHPLHAHIFGGGREQASPWLEIRSMVYLFFTGLCYYLGTQARTLGMSSGEVEVFFGGRGSTLLTWLASPAVTQAVLERAFRLGITRAEDDGVTNQLPPGPIRVSFSGLPLAYNERLPKLKTEVARGLLDSDQLRLRADMPKPGVFAGETGWMRDGRPLAWNSRLEMEDFKKLTAPPDAMFGSNMIGHFSSEVLQEDAKEDLQRLNLDATRLRTLTVHRNDVADLIGRSAEGDQAAQPLFAYELKALMASYAKAVQDEAGSVA